MTLKVPKLSASSKIRHKLQYSKQPRPHLGPSDKHMKQYPLYLSRNWQLIRRLANVSEKFKNIRWNSSDLVKGAY